MKANELMIGDWVKVTDDDTDDSFIGQVKAIDDLGNVNIPEGEDVAYPYSIDCLEPIPLTPEILEKNGFGYDPAHDIWIFKQGEILVETCIYSPNFINISYEYRTPEGEYCGDISSITKADGSDIMTHELQHALRLCGIEKEIVL